MSDSSSDEEMEQLHQLNHQYNSTHPSQQHQHRSSILHIPTQLKHEIGSDDANYDLIKSMSTSAPHASPSPDALDDASSSRRLFLPDQLATATLKMSPLIEHIMLFPSHRFDTGYQQQETTSMTTGETIDDRLTSYEQYQQRIIQHSSNTDSIMIPCLHAMNTPDQFINWNETSGISMTNNNSSSINTRQQQSSTITIKPLTRSMRRTNEEEKGFDTKQENTQSSAIDEDTTDSFKVSADTNVHTNAGSFASMIARSAPSNMEDDEQEVRPGFVQCVKCKKWRTTADDYEAKELWQCDLSPHIGRCNAVDETFEDGEFWPGMPIKFTRLVSHYDFYQRLVDSIRNRKPSDGEIGDEGELEKYPTVRKRPIDLLLAYETVTQLGGYDKVCASNQWRIVQSRLRIPDQWDSSFALKRIYKKFLFDYETNNWKNPRLNRRSSGRQMAARRTSNNALTSIQPSTEQYAGKKRAYVHKSLRSGTQIDEEDDTDDIEGSRNKKRRHSNTAVASAATAAALAAINSLNEELDDEGGDMQLAEESENEDIGKSRSSGTSSLSDLSAINNSLRSLRGLVESKFVTLERRYEERWNRLETSLMRTIKDGLAEIKEQTILAAASQRQRHLAQTKDLDRKQDLLARGMNMLISERLKANLPKVTQIRLRNTTLHKEDIRSTNIAQTSNATPAAAAAASSTADIISQGVSLPSSNLLNKKSAASNPSTPILTSSNNGTLRTSHVTEPVETKPTDNPTSAQSIKSEHGTAITEPSSSTPSSSHKSSFYDPIDCDSAPMDESKEDDADSTLISVTTFIPTLSPSHSLSLLPSKPQLTPSPRPIGWVRERLLECDGICFDVDSTVITDEGIDVLASHIGLGAEVSSLTTSAMNGSMRFEHALSSRLNLMKPSRHQVADCIAHHPMKLTSGFRDFIHWLRSDAIRVGGLPIYLVSGGFRQLIEPIRQLINIPESHLFANTLLFTHDGEYRGFDENELTSRSHGKARALEYIASRDHRKNLTMIGDGMTDVEASPPAKLMIGYGGVTIRQQVKDRAHYFVTDWNQIKSIIT